MTESNLECLKIPTGRRQTSWLFTQRSRGVELGARTNPVNGRVEHLNPETTRLQNQNPNHSATPPRVTSAIDALSGHFGLLLQ